MKSKDLQTRPLYSVRLSFKIKGEIKSFPENKAKGEHFHQTSIARDAKGTVSRRRNRQTERSTSLKRKMEMNKYLSIATLNIDALNAPIKTQRVAEWVRKHDLYICCLQRPTRTKDFTG